jgi:nucleoid-associated protein YgaU
MAREKEAGTVRGQSEKPTARRGVKTDDAQDLVEHLREHAKAEAPAEGRTYVVESGDSLSKIAQELLGDASRWPEIYAANKDKIEDPNLIHPGQELTIPS